jgi:hypothetical protein
MRKRCTPIPLAVALALAVVLGLPLSAAAQTPGDQAKRTLAILNEPIEMKDFQQPMTLKDALGLLTEKLEARRMELPILVDIEAFRAENPDSPDVYETKVQYPPFLKKLTVGKIIGIALESVPTRNATFLVLADHIEITTYEAARVENRLQKRILASFEKRRFSDVMRELSELSGTTIVIDKRASDKEERQISATFLNDVNLAGALRILTEMAELKVVVLDGAIFVTTPAHAETLRKEKLQLDEQLNPLWPILPPWPGIRRDIAATEPVATRPADAVRKR